MMRIVNNDPTITCPNANWNGTTTNYCNGVTSDDVVAHEWGHAYTEYTHGLIYQWQPGALNESYSDIWGETVDLINGRMDDDEGDITTKRPDGHVLLAHAGAAAARRSTPPPSIAKICAGRRRGRSARSSTDAGHHRRRGRGSTPPTPPARRTTRRAARRSPTRRPSPARSRWSTAAPAASPSRSKNAQDAGAVAVVVGNNVAERAVPGMAGADATITIPSVHHQADRPRPDRSALSGGPPSTSPCGRSTGDRRRTPTAG